MPHNFLIHGFPDFLCPHHSPLSSSFPESSIDSAPPPFQSGWLSNFNTISYYVYKLFFHPPPCPPANRKKQGKGNPPLLLPHLPHLSVCLSEIDSPGKGAPIHLLWHSLVWQRRNLPPLLPEMLSIPFYRCHIIILSSCPPISFPSILDVWGPVLSWP